jgi:hypothetical protein
MRDPCACAGGRAAFRVMAPDAHEAQLRIGMGSGMAKGDDGAWTATTAPLAVGFHRCSVVVDGAVLAGSSIRTRSN